MIGLLEILLRIAGAGLLLLVCLHIPIAKRLGWKEDARKLTAVNEQIFHVHACFICLCVGLMALPCLWAPEIFLKRSQAGLWISGSFAVFWACRLYFQFFVYRRDLWKGKVLETWIHVWFSLVWSALATLFGICFLIQRGWWGEMR